MRQTLASKVLELEHDSLYNKYKDRVGQVISGEVYQVWKREVLLVDDENNELILPKSEQIPNDQYRKGETVRAVILRVDNENNNPIHCEFARIDYQKITRFSERKTYANLLISSQLLHDTSFFSNFASDSGIDFTYSYTSDLSTFCRKDRYSINT